MRGVLIAVLVLLQYVAAILVGMVVLEKRSPYESLVDEMTLLTLGEDTQFAPEFTDRALSKISIGDPEARVVELLGESLSSNQGRANSNHSCLRYSRSPSSTHYRERTVCLSEGKVSKITAELYFD